MSTTDSEHRVEDLLGVPGVLGSFRASLDFGGIDVSPDGDEVVFAWNPHGVYDLHVVSLGDGAVRKLTACTSADRAMRPRYSPDGERIAYLRDTDGNELFHIWVVDRAGGNERPLTSGRANREAIEWSPDGRTIVYRAHAAGKLGIWLLDEETGEERVLVEQVRDPGSDHITPDLSPDGRFVAFHAATDEDPSNVVLLMAPVDGSAPPWRLETHPGERARAVLPKWSPDGTVLAFTSDARGRFEVGLLPVEEGRVAGPVRWLSEVSHDEAVLGWGPTGRLLYRRSIESAIHLRRFDPASGVDEPIVEAAGVCYSADEAADGTVAYAWTSPVSPQELFTKAPGREAVRHTHSLPEGFDQSALVQPEHVWYPGADDLPIPALLYRPKHAPEDGRLPAAIVWAHGGGTWQHLQNWDPIPQWFVRHGFVVLAPNARGSRGYGRSFREGNYHDWGGKDLEDHVKGADWLEREGIADGTRIAMYGSSGGGYMTSIALTKAPWRWAAGVTSCGLVSLETFYRTTRADLRGMVESYMGSPDDDPELFHDRSPLTHIDNIKAPLLVLHGGTDPRVPPGEAALLAEALKERGATYDYHVYPDEGHGFRDMKNQADALRRMVAWYQRHLG